MKGRKGNSTVSLVERALISESSSAAEVMEDGQKNAENFMQSHLDIKVITSIGSGGGAVHGEMLIDIADNFRNDVPQDQYMPITVIDASNAQEYYESHLGK